MSTTPERPKAVVLYNPLPLSYSIHFIFSPESFKEYSELLTILERNRNIDERKTTDVVAMSLVAPLSPFNHLKIMRFKILLMISVAL